MITDFKIDAFENPISKLPDAPQLSAPELKAYFDSSPDELKNALNRTIGELSSTQGAENVGFMQSDRIHADTVQEAIENVQGQIKEVVLGKLPEGSVDETRLAQPVLDRFAAAEGHVDTVEQALKAETKAREDGDKAVSSRVDSVKSIAEGRCRIKSGKYIGTGKNIGETRQEINVGFAPKLVIVFQGYVILTQANDQYEYGYVQTTKTGFTAICTRHSDSEINGFNTYGTQYWYVAIG